MAKNFDLTKRQANILLLVLFIISFISICWYYGYFEIFHQPPSGTHTWRQTDCTSIVMGYYQNGMQFFEPRVLHTMNGNSHASPSEFPILYYLTAGIYFLTDPHHGILRIVNLLILFIGFFALSKITFGITKDIFYSLAVPMVLVSSPIIAFYGFNYIPNIPALGLAYLGSYFFYKFFISGKNIWWISSLVIFLLGGLLKITTLLPFFTIFGIFFLEKLNLVQFKPEGKIFKKGWLNLLGFVSVLAIIGTWIMWVINYNEVHKCGIFLAKAKPIWSLKEPLITQTWHWIIQKGADHYHHRITRYVIFGLAFLLIFIFRKKQTKILYASNVLIFLGITATFFLFYRQFFIHDYYAIDLMVFPAIVLISFVYYLKKHHSKISNHLVTKAIIVAFIIFNISNAKSNMNYRFQQQLSDKQFNNSLLKTDELQDFLKNLNIQYPDKVIAMDDKSPNSHLYYFNLTGWSHIGINKVPFSQNLTNHLMDRGAKYLIISNATYLESEDVKPFLEFPLGTFDNSIFVYDLRPFRN